MSPTADQAPSPLQPPRQLWLPRVLLESLFIIVSVLVALAVDQWQETRDRNERATLALLNIETELRENRATVDRVRANHLAMRDSLRVYLDRKQLPPPSVYLAGVFNPALLHAAAWESARQTGATADFPYQLMLELTRVYDWQTRYRALGDALVQDLMIQVRREGLEPVMRDRAANFIALQEDFAGREAALLRSYDQVLAKLQANGNQDWFGGGTGVLHPELPVDDDRRHAVYQAGQEGNALLLLAGQFDEYWTLPATTFGDLSYG